MSVSNLDKPTVEIDEPDPNPVHEGDSVTIACRGIGGRPAFDGVRWTKGGTDVPGEYLHSTQQFLIS